MPLSNRLAAEFFGTFWLVLGGCGSAVLAAAFPSRHRLVGVSLAFGLTVLTMAYAIGHISGCHLNPAVSLGLVVGGRFPASDLLPYIVAQVAGAIAAAARALPDRQRQGRLRSSAAASPRTATASIRPAATLMAAALVAEFVLTFFFLMIILGATDERAPSGFAPIAIGLGLTLIHLISIPVTNTSVNPARSTGPALFVGGWALAQLWLFWVAPMLGAAAAGVVYRMVSGDRSKAAGVEGPASASALPKSPSCPSTAAPAQLASAAARAGSRLGLDVDAKPALTSVDRRCTSQFVRWMQPSVSSSPTRPASACRGCPSAACSGRATWCRPDCSVPAGSRSSARPAWRS